MRLNNSTIKNICPEESCENDIEPFRLVSIILLRLPFMLLAFPKFFAYHANFLDMCYANNFTDYFKPRYCLPEIV